MSCAQAQRREGGQQHTQIAGAEGLELGCRGAWVNVAKTALQSQATDLGPLDPQSCRVRLACDGLTPTKV